MLLCAALLFAVFIHSYVSAPVTLAGTINYTGPMPGPGGMTGWLGDDVWYGGVSESNTEGTGGDDGMTASLFGAPTAVTGNAIDFSPTNFEAQSEDGGFDITDGQLNFMVVAAQGKVINNLQFTEAGDTTLGGSPSTDATFSSVTTDIFIDVIAIDGVNVPTIINIQDSMTFTPSGGFFELNTDSGGGFFYQTVWNGFVLIDIEQALIDQGIDFVNGATKINVAIDNTLSANSILGTSSFIKKKDFDGITVTSNVPEPSTTLLAMLGCLASLTSARRR